METQAIRQTLRSGGVSLGAWLLLGSPAAAEVMAGYRDALADWQRALAAGPGQLPAVCQAIQALELPRQPGERAGELRAPVSQ